MSAERPPISLEILLGALGEMDDSLKNLERNVMDSAHLTDTVIGELSLQIAFLMQTIKIHETQNGGLAGPDGKVVSVTKSAAQVYIERGRAALIKQREELHRAKGLQTAAAPATGNGEATDDASKEAAGAVTGPRLVTH